MLVVGVVWFTQQSVWSCCAMGSWGRKLLPLSRPPASPCPHPTRAPTPVRLLRIGGHRALLYARYAWQSYRLAVSWLSSRHGKNNVEASDAFDHFMLLSYKFYAFLTPFLPLVLFVVHKQAGVFLKNVSSVSLMESHRHHKVPVCL